MGRLSGLSYNHKIGLLYTAHSVMIGLLDGFIGNRYQGWDDDISDIHLHLRLLIEDLLAEDEFVGLRTKYHCPFESLCGLSDPMPLFRARRGFQQWESSKRRLQQFQGMLTERHIRAGAPGCPDAEPYKSVMADLQQVIRRCRMLSAYHSRDLLKRVRANIREIEHLQMEPRGEGREKPAERISSEERKQREKHEYRCLDRLEIPGTATADGNVILVNGIETTLKDSELELLLCLAVELKRDKGGWVSITDLEKDHAISDAGKYQPYSRLRRVLQDRLLGKDAKKLIENDRLQRKRYRLSALPGRVTCDKARLLKHPTSGTIREIASRLPRARSTKASPDT